MNGFVSLADGAMSTRHGRIIFLKDLISESFSRVKNILVERGRKLSDEDTRAVALGAIMYSFLGQDRERDWIFDWDKVLAFEGNSGPYLQYTYVRWKKILEENIAEELTIHLYNETHLTMYDRDCIIDALRFGEIINVCGQTYKFHLLVAHLAQISRHLNALYVNTPKIKDTPQKERVIRLSIVKANLAIIELACKIL